MRRVISSSSQARRSTCRPSCSATFPSDGRYMPHVVPTSSACSRRPVKMLVVTNLSSRSMESKWAGHASATAATARAHLAGRRNRSGRGLSHELGRTGVAGRPLLRSDSFVRNCPPSRTAMELAGEMTMRLLCKPRTVPSLHQTPRPSSVPVNFRSLTARSGGQSWPQSRTAPACLVVHGCEHLRMCSTLECHFLRHSSG
jgi:hypothetical protein